MEMFEKYINYVRDSFAQYSRCIVKTRAKNNDREIITIHTKERPSPKLECGELGIIFDRETIGFFGEFLPDKYVDWDEKFWEKYTEKDILGFLDKEIVEYKNYIDNGYFFQFNNTKDDVEICIAETANEDFDKFNFEKVYLENKFKDDVDFNQIKSVIVSNFYGDFVYETTFEHSQNPNK